ncbi:MAG: hypothetical protein UX45_C0001G0047 [Candidatus Uhrbacteria bacterium GW2011_GWF2_46_218]|uniref:Uncharacterized protein n=1 Tax=Candidatus Uhrbacteria bacterium GW2011_GWF2_46_218 TaxID=1619001 RepID=A0A0G1RWI2_9BACT|nr:MAG: hypothetical protein UX45_C0001G0047 [Candidatus Uhrbacteria bacterium GW2011_GWF2_46_218]
MKNSYNKILIIFSGLVVLGCLFFVGSAYFLPSASQADIQTVPAILYLTTMTHLEDAWGEAATQEMYFKRVAEEVRYGMDLAEDYDAILTIETGLPFAEGCVNFNDNVMAEVLERGHGVGVHPDLPAKKVLPIELATDFIKKRIDALKNLVDTSAKSDWYTASLQAGCSFVDGTVAFAYLSMPMSARPDGYTDEAILTDFYHRPAPLGDERFYPFWINSCEDFVPDEDGDLLLGSGETFSLAMYAEIGDRNGVHPECGNECPLTTDDVEIFVREITDFANGRDTARIAKFNVYFPANLFVPENKKVLELFFKEAQKLQNSGVLQWASQAKIYEVMVADR